MNVIVKDGNIIVTDGIGIIRSYFSNIIVRDGIEIRVIWSYFMNVIVTDGIGISYSVANVASPAMGFSK